jgi:hypothetical protein
LKSINAIARCWAVGEGDDLVADSITCRARGVKLLSSGVGGVG